MKARILLALAFTLLTIGLAYGLQHFLFAPGADAAAAAPAPGFVAQSERKPEVAQASAKVESVSGQVQRRGADGVWVNVHVGDQLDVNSAVRTQAGSSARLAVGETTFIDVAEETELTVAEVGHLSRFRLEDGRIASVVKNRPGFRVRIEVNGTDVKAETSAGEFYVMKRGTGNVSVASKQGTTTVSAGGKNVDVAAGEQTVVEPGKAPAAPMKIPPSLLLKLGRVPPQLRTRTTMVEGATSPGAIVSINGEVTTANADGHFEQNVALREGENVLKVEAEDTYGRKQTATLPPIKVDSHAPNVVGKVKW